MKTLITEIKKVVPKGMKVFAVIALVAAAICATVFTFMSGVVDAHAAHPDMPRAIAIPLALLVGTLIALWLLAMGYIYGDAKRRGMPPVLWVAIAILVPNMIGVILYFALRKPLLSACANCGQGITPGQRFCPSCGREQGTNSPSGPTSNTGTISLNSPSDGLAQKSFATGLSMWVVIFAAKGMFSYWKHATVDAGGWLILAGVCALLVVVLQQRSVPSQIPTM